MEKQLELNAIPRKRVALVTEDKPQSDAHLGDQVANEVKEPACPPNQAVAEIWLGYTPWTKMSVAKPPVDGIWEFHDGEFGENGRVVVRKYFDPATDEAPADREWRGLAKEWPASFNPCLPQPINTEQAPKARRALLSD